MTKLKTTGALCAAAMLAFAASYASGRTPAPGAAVPEAAAAAPVESPFAGRQDRILRLVRVGRVQGWLDRAAARSAYRTLRGLKVREAEMRVTSGGRLERRDLEVLERGYDDLAQKLHWARARDRQAGYRPH